MTDELWKGTQIEKTWTLADLNTLMDKMLDDSYKKVCLNCNGNGVIWSLDFMRLQSCKKCKGTGCITTAESQE